MKKRLFFFTTADKPGEREVSELLCPGTETGEAEDQHFINPLVTNGDQV